MNSLQKGKQKRKKNSSKINWVDGFNLKIHLFGKLSDSEFGVGLHIFFSTPLSSEQNVSFPEILFLLSFETL